VARIFLQTDCKRTVHQVPETVDCCAGCLQQGHDDGWVRRREEQGQQQQGQEYDPGWHSVRVASGTCNIKWNIWSGQLTEYILNSTEWGWCVELASIFLNYPGISLETKRRDNYLWALSKCFTNVICITKGDY